ncbi:MAG: thioredoxin family protein [Planctomycetes bacterium]|nr:thioredoxin family protein [Planctomycetota bacterium]
MGNRKLQVMLAVAVALLVWQLAARGGAGALDYVGSWEEARELAAELKKPILLNFGGPW